MTRSYSASDASDAATATATAATTGPLNCVRRARGRDFVRDCDCCETELEQSVDLRHGSHEAVTQINGKTDKCELAT